MTLPRLDPVLVAERLFRDRYAKVQVLFCGGSIVRGEGTPTSDLDVVVVFERVERAWRDSFYFQGYPVEVFAHDHETLAYFIDHDEKQGRPVLTHIVAEALVVPHLDSSSQRLQEWARERVKSPRAVQPLDVLERARYAVTDLLDDFRDERPRAEQVSVACALYPEVCQFVLASRGAWSGVGKSLPRALRALDSELAALIEQGFERFFRTGDRSEAIVAVLRALEPFGGELFAGYKAEAPGDWRVSRDAVPWLG